MDAADARLRMSMSVADAALREKPSGEDGKMVRTLFVGAAVEQRDEGEGRGTNPEVGSHPLARDDEETKTCKGESIRAPTPLEEVISGATKYNETYGRPITPEEAEFINVGVPGVVQLETLPLQAHRTTAV